MAKLTTQQEQFAKEYIIDFNGTEAAIRAGYSKNTAAQQASRLLRKVNIQQAVTKAIAERTDRTEISQDWVLTKLVSNVERSLQAEAVYDREGNPTGEYTYQGSVANKALELLGKHTGLFTDKTENRHDIEIRINRVDANKDD